MYLQRRRRVWYALHEIPKSLREVLGKPRFVQSLETESEGEARARAAILDARWRGEIRAACAGSTDEIERLSSFWRRTYHSASSENEKAAIASEIRQFAHDEIVIGGAIAAGIHTEDDPRFSGLPVHDDAARFVALATGESVRLDQHLADYIKTLTCEPKSAFMKESTIRKFAEEFAHTGDITRRSVQKWADKQVAAGKALATIRRSLSELRGYWGWLKSHQQVPEDSEPFSGLTLPKAGKAENGDKRKPFAPADVVLLHGAALELGDRELADLIALGAFTGCRIEELCALPVGNVGEGYLEIEDAKTEAGWRKVPLHRALVPVVARLKGERKEGYLLAGLNPNKFGDRSAAIGKRFGRLKSDKKFGAAHVYHSIRKTVSTLLENAGVPENVAADILGHEKPRITYGLYSGGNNLTVLAEAVEKIAYPKWEALT